MFCKSCKAEIPPAFVKAIQKNECPGCGEAIMDEQALTLLTELKEAMAKMPNDPEGLSGWLLSNYILHKIGTAEPTQFYRAGKKEDGSTAAALKVNHNNPFMKRAGVDKIIQGKKNPQQIVEFIQQQQAEQYGGGEEEIEEELPEEDGVEMENSILIPNNNKNPLTPQEMTLMMEAIEGIPAQDELDSNAALQQARIERLRKTRDVANGGGGGSFRRGG